MTDSVDNFSSLYQQDYYQWLQWTMSQLQQRNFDNLDFEQLLEELAAMGRREEITIKSNLRLLIIQLLKWQHKPQHRCNGWVETISEYRHQLNDIFAASPSLKKFAASVALSCYQAACITMSTEDHFPVEHFPAEFFPDELPFSFVEILDVGYFPK